MTSEHGGLPLARGSVAPALLFADEQLLVIDKPAGVLSVPGRSDEPSLGDILKGLDLVAPDEPFLTVHRLDRDASGVIVFTRTADAQQRLTKAFGERRVEKVYIALVQGYVSQDGEVDLPIRAEESGTRAETAQRGGKESVTRYVILERFKGHTLLECRPLTGRLHQIRVHLAAVGHPLAVDPLYGGGSALYLSSLKPSYKASSRHEERPLIERLTLHAARISFEHPTQEVRISFESSLPKDFRVALHQLRRL